jgi:hypothetical protein
MTPGSFGVGRKVILGKRLSFKYLDISWEFHYLKYWVCQQILDYVLGWPGITVTSNRFIEIPSKA